MSTEIFQVLDIAGLAASPSADLFSDLPASDAGYQGSDVDDVLGALHAEFRQAISDPSHIDGSLPWPTTAARWQTQLPAREPGGGVPSTDNRAASPDPHVSLLEMLQPREDIDRFIARFLADLGPSVAPTLLRETRADEVLRLFAPVSAIARRQALPVTTRREHHELSPDSAMDMPGTVAGTSAASQEYRP